MNAKTKYFDGYDEFNRPSWDLYFMSLAMVVSQRSIDRHTKHGCVIVNEDKTILAVGYNGPPRGSIDQNVPLERPAKYDWMIHSEEAAIINAARHGISLKGSILYVTGHPCEKCMRGIINVGASEVVYGPIGSECVPDETVDLVGQMLVGQDLKMRRAVDAAQIQAVLHTTDDYISQKVVDPNIQSPNSLKFTNA